MTDMKFQVVVIGGGPGGYVAAIRAAQLGLNVAAIDDGESLGGTCLNVGCIPSKVLLHSSEVYADAQHKFGQFGIKFTGLDLDLLQMQRNKRNIVAAFTRGIPHLFKKWGVTHIPGRAAFDTTQRVRVTSQEGAIKSVAFDHCIIATGSRPTALPFAPFDEKQIVSSTGALAFESVPASLVVIGGGAIGLELASVWKRLGSQVHILEALPGILPALDDDVAAELASCLRKQDMTLTTGARLKSCVPGDTEVTVTYEREGSQYISKAEKVLIAIGRVPETTGLGLETIGIKLDPGKNSIAVNDRFQTNIPHIYAIGDVIRGAMLAHKAQEEGVCSANFIAGKPGHMDYEAIPNIIYTWPEVASVGKSSAECAAKGIHIKTGKIPFAANGRAKSMGETRGFVKLIADEHTDLLLGAQIVGPGAAEMIAELVLAKSFKASAEDIALTMHGHPTLAETVKEAALAVGGAAIHF